MRFRRVFGTGVILSLLVATFLTVQPTNAAVARPANGSEKAAKAWADKDISNNACSGPYGAMWISADNNRDPFNLENNIKIKGQSQGVVICPGPNLAYFDKEVSLLEMVKHIYGNASVLGNKERPNVIINELKTYMDYLKNEINEFSEQITAPQAKKLKAFKSNLNDGIEYYQSLIASNHWFEKSKEKIENQLKQYKIELFELCVPELIAVQSIKRPDENQVFFFEFQFKLYLSIISNTIAAIKITINQNIKWVNNVKKNVFVFDK